MDRPASSGVVLTRKLTWGMWTAELLPASRGTVSNTRRHHFFQTRLTAIWPNPRAVRSSNTAGARHATPGVSHCTFYASGPAPSPHVRGYNFVGKFGTAFKKRENEFFIIKHAGIRCCHVDGRLGIKWPRPTYGKKRKCYTMATSSTNTYIRT
jgi:hypothetical protein